MLITSHQSIRRETAYAPTLTINSRFAEKKLPYLLLIQEDTGSTFSQTARLHSFFPNLTQHYHLLTQTERM